METRRALFFFFFLALQSFAYANLETSSKNDDEEVMRSMFPDNFLFGTATSAYQIEGAYLEDGKSLGNCDVFTHVKEERRTETMETLRMITSIDTWYRFCESFLRGFANHWGSFCFSSCCEFDQEDIEIMESLGVNAYRFSISWPRILPRGRLGGINPCGIDFYNNIIDNLMLKRIEPFVTIHHHDIPQELEEKYQGWLSSLIHLENREDFVHLAKTCFENFGDRVKYWITFNEPNLVAEMAHIRGWYPPAHCSRPFGNCLAGNSDTEPLIAMHNMLLSHAKAAKLYRYQFQAKQGGAVGIVMNSFMFEPYQDNEADRRAVDRALAFNTAWVLDPLMYGYYPPEMRLYHGNELPSFSPEEIELVKGSLDFLGINHYSTLYAKDCLHSPCSSGNDRHIRGYVNTTGEREGIPIGERTTMERFFVVPRGREKIMDYVTRRYPGMPIFVTENGYSSSGEQENGNDVLQDIERIKFHKAYLAALARAIRKGADVRGYFIWSLLDSFEWIHGYSVRFGLYYINRRTLEQIPKLSARWYDDFLKGKGNI